MNYNTVPWEEMGINIEMPNGSGLDLLKMKEEEWKMKEKYTSPDMEIIVFATEDIITNSNELPIDPDE